VENVVPAVQPSISDLPPPQTHPLPQRPVVPDNRPSPLPMHQPRPQKAVSVADIESPTFTQSHQPYQQAFHQQVPLQMPNGYSMDHTRHPVYQGQHSTGTPLSQIPESAIHAAPFQPNPYAQQSYYGQPYPMMQPQQGFYYPTSFPPGAMAPSATAPSFVPTSQQGQPQAYSGSNQQDNQAAQPNGQPVGPGSNLIAQEVNGMVYYYDPTQLSAVNNYPSYPAPQGFVPGVVNMGGMVTPSPDGFFYGQAAPGMVYYTQ
jgi:hypothetical protein